MEAGKVITRMFRLMGVKDPETEYQRILDIGIQELDPQFKSSFVYKGAKNWTSEVAQVTAETSASDIEADTLNHQLRIQCNDCILISGECQRGLEEVAECHKDDLALHWAKCLERRLIRLAYQVQVESPLMDADKAYRRAAEAVLWASEEPGTEAVR